MPCRSDYPSDYDTRVRRDLDLATRVACTAIRAMSRAQVDALPKECRDWWVAHLKADDARIARENAEAIRRRRKEEALKKLTPDERKLLGL